MAATNFRVWFKTELVFEGGKVDHPRDPGGRTNMGVTQRVYNGFRKARNLPTRDVYGIEAAEVAAIYKTGYWDKVWGDRLPDGLDVVVADGAINSGVSQSLKWLQRALGVRVDGIMGDATLTAAEAVSDMGALIDRVIAHREAFLRALRTFKTFGKGWLRRTAQLRNLGRLIASGEPANGRVVSLTALPGMNAKASLEDAKKALPKLDALWGAGSSTGILAQATSALEPLQNLERVATLLAVVTAVGTVLAIAGGAWAWYARRKTAELNEALDVRPDTPANDNADEPVQPTVELPAGIENLADAS